MSVTKPALHFQDQPTGQVRPKSPKTALTGYVRPEMHPPSPKNRVGGPSHDQVGFTAAHLTRTSTLIGQQNVAQMGNIGWRRVGMASRRTQRRAETWRGVSGRATWWR